MNSTVNKLKDLINRGLRTNSIVPEVFINRLISENGEKKTLDNFEMIIEAWKESDAEYREEEWEEIKLKLQEQMSIPEIPKSFKEKSTKKRTNIKNKPIKTRVLRNGIIKKIFYEGGLFENILVSILFSIIPSSILGYLFSVRAYFSFRGGTVETSRANSDFYLSYFNYKLFIILFILFFCFNYLYLKYRQRLSTDSENYKLSETSEK